MSGDVIVTVTLNAALHVSYAVSGPVDHGQVTAVSRPRYRAGGRGVTVARMLHRFGHEVLAAGFVGGTAGERIVHDLARSGIPAAFTPIRGDSRRIISFRAAGLLQFGEPGPYITTEELGRFAADYRRLLAGAAAVVLSGGLPEGLPHDMYASLVRYAGEAGVPAVLDVGGEELLLAVRNRPELVIAQTDDPGAARDLFRVSGGAVALMQDHAVRVITGAADWTAHVDGSAALDGPIARAGLVAGLVPGQLLGWPWPDRLRHAVALAASGAQEADGDVDIAAYERLLGRVAVRPTVT